MPKFDFLNDLKVAPEDTAELTIYSVELPNGKNPTLIGKHAGETNKPYANRLLKKSVVNSKLVKAGKMDVGMLERNRDQDRALFPIHVLTGWKDVCDAAGKDVAFTPDEAKDFVDALPNDIFDEVRDFFADAVNFRNTVDPEDAVAKGK